MTDKRGTKHRRTGWAARLILSLAAAFCVMFYQNCGADFVPMNLDSASGAFFVCNNDHQSNFQRTVYNKVLRTLACKDCHRTGGAGTGVFADGDLALAYTDFTTRGIAKIQQYATTDHQGAGSPANKSWVDVEFNKFTSCQEGGGNSFQAMTTEKVISAGTTDTIMSFDLDTELTQGPSPTGARMYFLIRRSTATDGSAIYHLSRPSLQTTTRGIRIRSLKIRINGQLVTTFSTFSNVDRSINANTSHLAGSQLNGNLETATGLMQAANVASDTIQFEIGTLETY
jgi:hypothetical protein